ncbi:magnesium and cobalt transport protein CorA [Roseivivax marinus]|uniref:Magnesium transport protein CorA n=1 Tax=Roseivivax marinus TaxID=1379903 RepID=W4HPF9_9RHOB|nr:magnesium/cobalt transporter CorA [Roseivivax marinus]ETW13996.1 magnesium and cobalt transport protein CorA [Roseivivax marinus]
MIRSYLMTEGRLERRDAVSDEALWIDMIDPTGAEVDAVERLLGFSVPARADMEEIEVSSRLYLADGGAIMTAILPAHTETDDPEMSPVSFVLAKDRLVTIRYHEPRAFTTFPARAEREAPTLETAEGVLIALLEAVVDRLADILERAAQEIDGLSRRIFQRDEAETDHEKVLGAVGAKGELLSNIRDSLVTLDRLARFLGHVAQGRGTANDLRDRIKTLSRDVRSLLDHAGFLSQKITFLLDATLGMISIEQNAIIKIFSVVAVMFLPPTLIASVYGMNFQHMPELAWPLGYPIAVAAMMVSAILPYFYFKRRGWL